MNKEEKLNKWLEKCHTIVLHRIIERPEELLNLSITNHVYDENTLVCIPITILPKFEKLIKKYS